MDEHVRPQSRYFDASRDVDHIVPLSDLKPTDSELGSAVSQHAIHRGRVVHRIRRPATIGPTLARPRQQPTLFRPPHATCQVNLMNNHVKWPISLYGDNYMDE